MEDNLLDGNNNGSALSLPAGCSEYTVDADGIATLTYTDSKKGLTISYAKATGWGAVTEVE